MVDTCQANTLYSKFYSPNIVATGSSAKDENSFSVRAHPVEHGRADAGSSIMRTTISGWR